MKTKQPFDWFPPASCQTLADQLAQIGPDHCRLEVYRNEKGALMLQVRQVDDAGRLVTGAATSDPPPINDSFLCPPIC